MNAVYAHLRIPLGYYHLVIFLAHCYFIVTFNVLTLLHF